MRRTAFALGLMASAAGVGTAYAQPGAADREVIGLEEVVVTAQRVEETSQRAALAISVIQPEAIANVTNAVDLGKAVPALQLSSGGGSSPIIYLRGVGTFAANPYTDNAVAVNFDGVYIGRPTSANGMFYDLQRVEVLKGPQGTLYGRNATGGALNVIPARPKLGAGSFDGVVSLGNFSSYNVQTALNIPLTETTAVRISTFANDRDGYNTDGTDSENGAGGRVQLLWEPNDDVSLRLLGDYADLGGTGGTSVVSAFRGSNGSYIPSGLSPDVGMFDPQMLALLNSPLALAFPAGAVFGSPPAYPYRNNDYYGLQAELNWNLGFGQLTLLPAWRKGDLNQVQNVGFTIGTYQENEQVSFEARLAGETGKLKWLAGLYYFDEEVDSAFVIHNNVLLGDQRLKADNTSYAAFGRLVWSFTDTFRLTGALRYTKDEKTFDGVALSATAVCTTPSHICPGLRRPPGPNVAGIDANLASVGYIRPPGAPVYVDVVGGSGVIWSPGAIPVNESTETEKVTYRVAAEYEPRDGSLLYASFETGYRAGGFSFSTIAPTYRPETIEAYTVGSKNRFFDNRLQLNLEAFYWKYEDQQVSHSTIGRTGGQEFGTENIGSSTNQGIEVELVARPLPDTQLSATVQYLNAKNDEFVFTEVNNGALPSTRCPATLNPGGATYRVDCSGLRAIRSPEWTMNFGAEQSFNVSDNYKLVVQADTRFQSETIVAFERIPTYHEADETWTSNASLTFAPQNDRWALSAYVQNIEDKRVRTTGGIEPFSGFLTSIYSPPRTYGVRFRMHLGE